MDAILAGNCNDSEIALRIFEISCFFRSPGCAPFASFPVTNWLIVRGDIFIKPSTKVNDASCIKFVEGACYTSLIIRGFFPALLN